MTELQAKVDAYDKNIDLTLNEKIKDVSERMLEEYNEKLKVIDEVKEEAMRKNVELEDKLRSTQQQLKEAKAELFDSQSHKDEKHEARSQEVDILLNDLEVMGQRAAEAEKEVEMLRDKVETMKKVRRLINYVL